MSGAMGWRALSTTSPQPPRVSKPALTRRPSRRNQQRAGVDYEGYFKLRLGALHAEGRYRVFADLERRCGRFPRAFDHRIGAEVTVWCVGGTFTGGNFWDGRSTGYLLQSPDAEQAQHPPVDTQEHMFADDACIAFRLTSATYRQLFELVWGADFDIRWPANTAEICGIPQGARRFGGNTTPIALSPVDRTKANNIYDHWGQSISFLEKSTDISPFTSKYDAFLVGNYTLTADEMAGYNLFNGKGNCNSCHTDGRSTLLTPGQTATRNPAGGQAIFTCLGYANEGLPLNPRLPLFYESTPDGFGFTPNPDGLRYRDLGFGNFLRSGPQSAPDPNSSNWLQFAPSTDGQFQVVTVRDVAMTPPQCPTTEA